VNLQTRVVTISESILRFYLYDPSTHAPEINNTKRLNSSEFKVKLYGPDYFSMQLFRNDDKKSPIFNTSLGPKIACDDYWELALQLPFDAAVFGLGGLRLSSSPKLLYNSGHRLGSNPFIMIVDITGKAHGILFKNSGPMEFQLLETSNILSVKSRSRVMWDISVFAGPAPADVMEQYTSIDGLRPALPPAWALGFHICRDTKIHNMTLATDDAIYFLGNATDIKLPYDSDCLQERLLYQMDLSISTDMDDVIEEFKNTGKKLLLSLPPHVSSTKALHLPVIFEDKV
jgi:alpha-glucosidase (family GH31 glycosyl hydrolase)